MASTQTHTDVANRLRPALLKLARELRRESHALGVTGGQVTLLIQIHRNRGIGVNELAARERISAAAMSKHVARLERRRSRPPRAARAGRTPPEPVRDRRGRARAALGQVPAHGLARARLKKLDPAELEALDAAIEPLLQLLEDE